MYGRNNYGNQNNNGVNVNTAFKTFFSDFSSLNVGAWNAQLSLKLTPAMATNPGEMRQYDQNRRVSTALYPEKALTLVQGYTDVILPEKNKYENGDEPNLPAVVAVAMGNQEKKSVLMLEYKKDNNGVPQMYLTLCQMVRPDNTVDAQNITTYQFGENSYISGYDPMTGRIAGEKFVESEFDVFFQLLNKVVDLMPMDAHATKYAAAIGAKYSNNQSANGGATQQSRPANNYPTPAFASYDAPMSTYAGGSDMGLPFN